jgi:hypothetical protein
MATGQTILDLMEVLDNELQNQAAEVDVARSLIALNAAQDYFESIAALQPDFMGDTIGTVTTTANVEATAFPTGLLRLDKLQYIDTTSSPNLPTYYLEKRDETGGHIRSRSWPLTLAQPSLGTGAPRAYWEDGRNIYWSPLPNGTYTIRWYGFSAASAITAGGTFAYPDIAMLPFASFACRLMKIGVGDDGGDVDALAQATFGPVVKSLAGHNRDEAPGYQYRYAHIT